MLTAYKSDNFLLERKRVIIGDCKAINNFYINNRAAFLFTTSYLFPNKKDWVYK